MSKGYEEIAKGLIQTAEMIWWLTEPEGFTYGL